MIASYPTIHQINISTNTKQSRPSKKKKIIIAISQEKNQVNFISHSYLTRSDKLYLPTLAYDTSNIAM